MGPCPCAPVDAKDTRRVITRSSRTPFSRSARAVAEPSIDQLRLRAASWHRERGELQEAASYALEAKAWEDAAELIRAFLPDITQRLDDRGPLYWLRQLPESFLRADPRFYIIYAASLLADGAVDIARPLIETWPRMPEIESIPQVAGWHAGLKGLLAYCDDERDEALYQNYRSLALLPFESTGARLLAWSGVYREERARGNSEVAKAALWQADLIRKRVPGESLYWHFLLVHSVINDTALQGNLTAAEKMTRHFLHELPASLRKQDGRYRYWLLRIYLERNQLDLAAIEAASALKELQTQHYRLWHSNSRLALADYYLALGDTDQAESMIQDALQSSREHGGLLFARGAETALADYWLRTGQEELARLWADKTQPSPHLTRDFGELASHAVRLRLLRRQHALREAEELVTGWIDLARACHHVPAEIEGLVWASVLARDRDAVDDADELLRMALELGAPGGFVRLYGTAEEDLGPAIRALLPALSDRARDHAIALTVEPTSRDPFDDAGLTGREREVLAELASGKSNRDIAESLFITERTVKKHLANLFRKTGTTNRTALALWARERASGSSGASAARSDQAQPPRTRLEVPSSP